MTRILPQNLLGVVDRRHGILTVGVGSDSLGIFRRQHCAAHHHLNPGRPQQSSQAQRPCLGHGRHSCSFQQHLDDVFTDVMDVSFTVAKMIFSPSYRLACPERSNRSRMTSKAALAASALISSCGRNNVSAFKALTHPDPRPESSLYKGITCLGLLSLADPGLTA